jgi:hypothetical protein
MTNISVVSATETLQGKVVGTVIRIIFPEFVPERLGEMRNKNRLLTHLVWMNIRLMAWSLVDLLHVYSGSEG